ncbi:hypothetical protein HETIRDRAFT_419569 [Heterobasidion irregulare TC 32-1]|uniref:Uncharacterized protein n=1 Tax=Heterobasidion irregulare (strain TC 32-1) TaxID=747525 RepID=W4K292_HETIT|nr:uncharacterized protein HETIRDRAFT_419569 [Heterobasidion irregulare TC 32-1]ETW79938.1 hypothetical protein HETIRDRAFT_419569 [Heterobasidion irregulare TC 32-1]
MFSQHHLPSPLSDLPLLRDLDVPHSAKSSVVNLPDLPSLSAPWTHSPVSHLHPKSTRSPHIGSLQSQIFTPPATQSWSCQLTRDNATAEDLLRFNNSAFKLLLENHKKLKTTCLALKANLQASRDLLNKMIQALPQVYSLITGSVADTHVSPLASIINVGTAPSNPASTELDLAAYNNATVKAY